MSKNIVIILVSVLVAGGVVFSLGRIWPQSDATEGNGQIHAAIEQAKPHLARAAGLLNAPVYRTEDSDDTPPLAQLTEADRIVPMPGAVNPKAWTAMAEIDAPLTDVLAKHPGADPQVRALGLQMLGDINKLKGDYHAAVAAFAQRGANVELGLAEDACQIISLGTQSREHHRMLARETLEGPSSSEISRIRDEAVAARDTAGARLAEILAAIEGLTGEVDSLTARINELAEQEADLRQDSRTHASALDSQRLMNEALDVKAQIDQAKNEREDKGRQIELARQDQRLVESDLQSQTDRVAVAEAALEERRALSQAKSADIEDAAQVVSVAEGELMAAIDRLIAAGTASGEANATAIEYFLKALSNADQALKETGGGETSLLAWKAQSLALLAKTRMDDRALQVELNRLGELADKAYAGAVPAAVSAKLATLQGRIADPAAQDQTTLDELQDAADLLERVVKAARRDDRADYYGQLAGVYFLRYRMTGDDADRSKGEDRLRSAKSTHGEMPIDDPLRRMQPVAPLNGATPAEPPVEAPAEPAEEPPVELPAEPAEEPPVE